MSHGELTRVKCKKNGNQKVKRHDQSLHKGCKTYYKTGAAHQLLDTELMGK